MEGKSQASQQTESMRSTVHRTGTLCTLTPLLTLALLHSLLWPGSINSKTLSLVLTHFPEPHQLEALAFFIIFFQSILAIATVALPPQLLINCLRLIHRTDLNNMLLGAAVRIDQQEVNRC